jgi:rhodanese-related sulfurtransferase
MTSGKFLWRRTALDALFIVAVSAAIGLGYAAFTRQGLFAERQAPIADGLAANPPQFVLFDEATQLFQSGEATFVDARHEFDYKLGHIKGAINVPLKDFSPEEVRDLSKGKTLVVYCDGQECNSSVELAKQLASLGFTRVKIFFGGWREWTENKQPTEP